MLPEITDTSFSLSRHLIPPPVDATLVPQIPRFPEDADQWLHRPLPSLFLFRHPYIGIEQITVAGLVGS